MKTVDVRDALLEILNRTAASTQVRVGAAKGLSYIGDVKSLFALRDILNAPQEDDELRAAVAEALGKSCEKTAL
ncbi:HEAT repeat domain-containing protein [Pseudomonas mandelii]|uniref:HEAT repeat domain-containing protein n=1 Tax=Pseudomonas mandelii TaxID=75612 RepID=UPI00029B1425|nr:HEAT repeat domain-containing protein [Pseudomonas mandelii]OYQ22138.1 HEAT repeat domain-containing protein [Pseudomonas mandelii]